MDPSIIPFAFVLLTICEIIFPLTLLDAIPELTFVIPSLQIDLLAFPKSNLLPLFEVPIVEFPIVTGVDALSVLQVILK